MHPRRRVLIGAAAALLAGGGAPARAQNIPGTAARVNGAEISNFRLERHFEEYLKGQRRNITSMINPRVYKKLKREALDQLIEREILWQAAKADGVIAADDEVQAALAQLQSSLKSRDEFLRKLDHAGFDEKSYGEYLRQELSGAKYLRARSSESPTVSDDEVAAFYKENLHRYQTPESVQARHILIRAVPTASDAQRAEARKRIEALREQLRGGADFAELARSSSEDNSAFDGGDLGAVPRGKTVKAFEDALFALAPGQVSDVVQTSSGFHLIRAGERMPAVTQPLDAVRDGIRARLLAEKRTAVAREMVAKLRAAARVEVLVPLSD